MADQVGACRSTVDDTFGPWAGQTCRGGFDFTLLFEESILTIPLSCLFLIALGHRVMQLARTNVKVAPSPLRLYKACASVCLVAINATLLALWANNDSGTLTRATIPSAALSFIAALGYLLLSWLEHDRSVRPSFIVSSYLSVTILFDSARARTLWMLNDGDDGNIRLSAILFTTGLALRAVMFLLESTEKRAILASEYKGLSQEVTCGPLSQGVFFWLTSMFLKGYKDILTLRDLYPLDEKLRSEGLYRKLARDWDKVPNKTTPNTLFLTWLRTFLLPITLPILPKLFEIAFTYAQPFLVTEAIALAALPHDERHNNTGYGLIGAYLLVYTGIAVSTGQYEWRIYRAATMMRGSVVPLIYRKSLSLDSMVANATPSAALTLASTDVETISLGIAQIHEIWGGVLEIGVAVYLLYRQLGVACAMPVALVFVILIGTGFVAVPTGRQQAAWNQASQERVTATSKVLGSVKSLRVSGLSEVAFGVIRRLRSEELAKSKRFRLLLGVCMALAVCAPTLSPILTFGTFAGIEAKGGVGDGLTISKAFTSLSLILLLNKPLARILVVLPPVAGAVSSFQRIQDFLNNNDRVDNRVEGGGGKSSEGKSAIIASIHGKFSWSAGDEPETPILDISNEPLHILRQPLVLILGPVGCGKSTLLKALLGELASGFEGTIETSYSGVSYCDQTPWLPNDTVRNIITGQQEHAQVDERWYRAVIQACELELDISSWPARDDTPVGMKGISMSGGQKQRIAIARAVYAKRKLLVLDDVLSGLDSGTEDKVFENLYGRSGLLRRADVTSVLLSSDARRVPFADQVIVLDSKGRVEYTGSPEGIEGTKTVLNNLVGQKNKTPPEIGTATTAQQHDNDRVRHVTTSTSQPDTTRTPPTVPLTIPTTLPLPLPPSNPTLRQKGDPTLYKFYLSSTGSWPIFTTFLLSMVLLAFCEAFTSIWLMWWAEDSSSTTKQPNPAKYLSIYALLGLVSLSCILLGAWQLLIVVINNSGVYFHDLLVGVVSKAGMGFFYGAGGGVGEILNRFSQDLMLIDMELPAALFGTVLAEVLGVAQLVMVCVSSRYMGAVVVPVFLGVLWVVQRFYLRTSRQVRLLDIEGRAPLFERVVETVEGVVSLRAFGWEGRWEGGFWERLDRSQRASYLLVCLQRWLGFVVDMVVMVMALGLVVFVATVRERIGPGLVGVALSNILGFGATMKGVIESWVLLETALGAVARVKNFQGEVVPEDDGGSAVASGDIGSELDEWPSQGVVEICNLSASYDSSRPVLKGVTMTIRAGEKIGICGRTGSGKSSFVLCLLRMMDMGAGSTVVIDGADICSVPRDTVRSKLVAVPQEAYIFDGHSVRFNLDPGGLVDDEDIVNALDKVGLWPVIQQRGGLDSIISDDNFLSQGQIQLLVFARAMVRKGKVLILDEVTSSLDKEASEVIDKMIRAWFRDWTVLVIAHKLDSILDFDRVAVLDEGALVEYDAPGTLLKKDGSLFKQLYEVSGSTGS